MLPGGAALAESGCQCAIGEPWRALQLATQRWPGIGALLRRAATWSSGTPAGGSAQTSLRGRL